MSGLWLPVIPLANTLLMLVGFTLGALTRHSPSAIVSYMICAFVAPALLAFLAFNQRWFHDARPWVDATYNQDALLRSEGLSTDAWSQIAVTRATGMILPLIVAVYTMLVESLPPDDWSSALIFEKLRVAGIGHAKPVLRHLSNRATRRRAVDPRIGGPSWCAPGVRPSSRERTRKAPRNKGLVALGGSSP